MKQNQDLIRDVLENGTPHTNRTGVRTTRILGASIRFDLTKGYPAPTLRKGAFKSTMGEAVGFLRAVTSAADFRALGCKFWDQNANENAAWLANPFRNGEDDLGPVYGAMWRRWPAYKDIDLGSEPEDSPASQARRAKLMAALGNGYEIKTDYFDESGNLHVLLLKHIDQLRGCLETIISNPDDRRILYHGWNPAVLDEIALPSCHIMKEFLVDRERREISMCTFMRSCDVFLGLPANTMSEAAMLHLVGRLTGYKPKWLTMYLGDTHIYDSHLEQCRALLEREPLPLPTLKLSDGIPSYAETGLFAPEWLDLVEPSDFTLLNYQHHPALTAPMAV
jgi:thymidylate synthase